MRQLRHLLIPLSAMGLAVVIWLMFSRQQTFKLAEPNLAGYPAYTRTKIQEAIAVVRPEIALDWHDLADTLFAGGFYAEAETCYRHASTLNPIHPRFRYHWAFCLSSIGDIAQSDEQFRHAIDLGHSHPEACRHFIGLNALREGRTKDAQQAFNASSELAVSRLQLAEQAIRDDNLPHASTLLNELLQEQPNAWRIYHLLAVVARQQGDTTTEQQHAAFADVVSEHVRGPWHSRAASLQKLSMELGVEYRVNMAVKQLRRPQNLNRVADMILAENREAWDPLLEDLLSNVDLARDDGESQVARLRKTIAKDGVDSYRAARLGFALLGQQKIADAKHVFETGIHLLSGGKSQQVIDMCGALAELRRNAGEVTSADHMEAWGEFLKGTLLLEQLAIPQAAAAFLRSVELNNSPARTWFWLGRSQQLLGEAESAIRAFDECLKRNPDHQRALRYRSALSASKADIPNTPPPRE
jgi:tetratricopeptide (TPR) repeat protein